MEILISALASQQSFFYIQSKIFTSIKCLLALINKICVWQFLQNLKASVSSFITDKQIAKLTYIVLVLQIGYYVDSDDKIFHVKFFVPDKNKVNKYKWKYYICNQKRTRIYIYSSQN